jgi:hypothetical protein
MRVPAPRGPVSAALADALPRSPHELPTWLLGVAAGPTADPTADPAGAQPVTGDEDLQLSLFTCYELHYRGLSGVDDGWEWEPSLLALRRALECRLVRGLRDLVAAPAPVPAADLPRALRDLVDADTAPPLATFLQRRATSRQFREFVVHRSLYHLKEADPHTWGIPRLVGRAKAALVEIQADEYGGGRPGRMHAELFAGTMRTLGLRDEYGGYVDEVPAVTLATNTAASLFGLHRRWRGALVGHLAALEMTSSLPNRRYGNGLRRLGYGVAATRFYDEHVEADAVHEQVAMHDLAGSLAAAEPHLVGDILFGAACCLALDGHLAAHLLGRWQRGLGSLRDSAPASTVAGPGDLAGVTAAS